jgi:nucleoside-diphosphate-sugar epimerase
MLQTLQFLEIVNSPGDSPGPPVHTHVKHFSVQLAADPRPEAPWESTLTSNIIGLQNILEIAVQEGVKVRSTSRADA